MNSTKPFIILALVLAMFAAVGQIFFTFFAGKTTDGGITANSISLLPEALNVEQLADFTTRAEKYLLLTPKQFEDGVDPTGLEVTPTPTITTAP